MKKNRPVLLLEDDQVDQMNVKRAFQDLKVVNQLDIFENGEEGLDYLKDDSKDLPCVILLDLNMPRMAGVEFLKVIKSDDRFKLIPVIVLTTSNEERDMVDSYSLGVAGYMLKPVDYKEFLESIRTIELYWSLCEIV